MRDPRVASFFHDVPWGAVSPQIHPPHVVKPHISETSISSTPTSPNLQFKKPRSHTSHFTKLKSQTYRTHKPTTVKPVFRSWQSACTSPVTSATPGQKAPPIPRASTSGKRWQSTERTRCGGITSRPCSRSALRCHVGEPTQGIIPPSRRSAR